MGGFDVVFRGVCGFQYPPCLHMFKTRSTKGIPYTFFVIGVVNAAGGLWYGILINVSGIKFINAVALVTNMFYIAIYLNVIKSKSQASLQLFSGVFFLASLWFYLTQIVKNSEAVTTQLGSVLFVVTLFLLAAPALEIIEVVQLKTSEHMSLSMLCGGLLCCSAWLVYGMMLGDFNIYAPNFLGISVALMKFPLLFIYPGKKDKVL